jgi:hypothetical protein
MTQVYGSTTWNNRKLSLMIAAVFIVVDTISIWAQTDDNTNAFGCTLCADGSVPNFDATIGETSCRTIANAISQTPANSELCVMTQLQGYIYCNCPTYPSDTYCSLCAGDLTATPTNATIDDGAGEYYYNRIPTQNRDNIIPDTNLTCGEAEFSEIVKSSIPNSSPPSCTSRFPDSAAEYCGCISRTKKTCFLCSDATNTSMLHTNRFLPPLFTTSCGSLDRSIGLLVSDNNDECSGTNTTIGALFQTIPVAVQEYCGCSSDLNVSQPLDTCNICNGTQSVRNPNATITMNNNVNDEIRISCADLEIVSRYITNDTYCTSVLTQYESVCCSNETVVAPTIRNRTNIPRAPSGPVQSPSMSIGSSITNTSSNNTTSSSSRISNICTFQSFIQTVLPVLTSLVLLF